MKKPTKKCRQASKAANSNETVTTIETATLRERYILRRNALAEELNRMEETDPQMARSARDILSPAH